MERNNAKFPSKRRAFIKTIVKYINNLHNSSLSLSFGTDLRSSNTSVYQRIKVAEPDEEMKEYVYNFRKKVSYYNPIG